ncbi:MAG TPA: type I methionyl aminopeptidase [Candidatus Moranbacteria bacterium]|nr:type I methionyl aminopeptidase [Candidatus Moranbacteria bacterium]
MVVIKTQNEIESMRRGGKILAGIMEEIGEKIAPGINTLELDKLAERLVFDNGGKPAFKGYGEKNNPYPATICASINNEVVHGIPSEKIIIREGDLVKIDIGMEYKGMITDMARTFPVGTVSLEAHKLVKATQEALNQGIAKIRAGAKLSEYSEAVESYVRTFGFSVIRDLVGHGVGKILHEDPQIPNYRWNVKDIILKEGMTLALEPMINEGKFRIKLGADGWTYITDDGKLSAHFEDTVLVKKGGCEILTRK